MSRGTDRKRQYLVALLAPYYIKLRVSEKEGDAYLRENSPINKFGNNT